MINTSQLTLVFQGYVHSDSLGSGATDGLDLLYNIQRSREAYPDATIILSTWDNIDLPEAYDTAEKLGIDELILSADPGGLPNIKFGFDTPNNVNRQIVSTQKGLEAVTTEYAIKLRTDSFLTSARLLETLEHYSKDVNSNNQSAAIQAYSPIVVSNYFSIDPMVYEHMAYHISDWMQFAKTEVLQQYWSLDPMRYEDATYFENNEYSQLRDQSINTVADDLNDVSNHTNDYTDDTFRTRLAVEQYITTNHAKNLGYTVPTDYNHINDDIIADFKRYVAKHIIIADHEQTGFELPKYDWVNTDDFMNLNCLQHADWYQLFITEHQIDNLDSGLLAQAQSRIERKNSLDSGYNMVNLYPINRT